MTIILGIDPGSRITGYGIIEKSPLGLKHITSGVIKSSDPEINLRLVVIFKQLEQVIATYKPQQLVIEQVFISENPQSALKLGMARGVAILAGSLANIPVFELSARQAKKFVTGLGSASKSQVNKVVTKLLQLDHTPAIDASDALALAIAHAHTITTRLAMAKQQKLINEAQDKLSVSKSSEQHNSNLWKLIQPDAKELLVKQETEKTTLQKVKTEDKLLIREKNKEQAVDADKEQKASSKLLVKMRQELDTTSQQLITSEQLTIAQQSTTQQLTKVTKSKVNQPEVNQSKTNQQEHKLLNSLLPSKLTSSKLTPSKLTNTTSVKDKDLSNKLVEPVLKNGSLNKSLIYKIKQDLKKKIVDKGLNGEFPLNKKQSKKHIKELSKEVLKNLTNSNNLINNPINKLENFNLNPSQELIEAFNNRPQLSEQDLEQTIAQLKATSELAQQVLSKSPYSLYSHSSQNPELEVEQELNKSNNQPFLKQVNAPEQKVLQADSLTIELNNQFAKLSQKINSNNSETQGKQPTDLTIPEEHSQLLKSLTNVKINSKRYKLKYGKSKGQKNLESKIGGVKKIRIISVTELITELQY